MGASMDDLVEAIKYLRRSYPKDPFLVLLDEVHLSSQWSLGCKVIFDQVPNTFLVCTGSSALSLRLGPDSARRVDVIKVHPLSLEEFVAISQVESKSTPPLLSASGLSLKLQEAAFDASDANEAYVSLVACGRSVNDYYQSLDHELPPAAGHLEFWPPDLLLSRYINDYGTLPYFAGRQYAQPQPAASGPTTTSGSDADRVRSRVLAAIDQTLIKDTIKLMADDGDWSQLGFQLQASTIARLPELVSILANSGQISLSKIGKQLKDVHQKTLQMMLKVLVASEMLIEVSPIGTSRAKSTKTPKYLFAAPALRQALVPSSLPQVLADNSDSGLRGRLLEDMVVMYLERMFGQPGNRRVIEYDSSSGGADFVVTPSGLGQHGVVLEVGWRKTSAAQVGRTLRQSGRYGLVITSLPEPKLDTTNNAVYLPLSYFALC